VLQLLERPLQGIAHSLSTCVFAGYFPKLNPASFKLDAQTHHLIIEKKYKQIQTFTWAALMPVIFRPAVALSSRLPTLVA
jgi:hypothetical protein